MPLCPYSFLTLSQILEQLYDARALRLALAAEAQLTMHASAGPEQVSSEHEENTRE
jgi:hypothetical protein